MWLCEAKVNELIEKTALETFGRKMWDVGRM